MPVKKATTAKKTTTARKTTGRKTSAVKKTTAAKSTKAAKTGGKKPVARKAAKRSTTKATSATSAKPRTRTTARPPRVKRGDLILIAAQKVGSPPREGEVLQVIHGDLAVSYRVRWANGAETLISPAPGSARFVSA